MSGTLSVTSVLRTLPRWEPVYAELSKLSPDHGQQFKSGTFREILDYTAQGAKKTASIDAACVAASYVRDTEAFEAGASAVRKTYGWLRPLQLRIAAVQYICEITGQSAARSITGIMPEYEQLLVERIGGDAMPSFPLLVQTAEDCGHVEAFLTADPELYHFSHLTSAPSLEAFGRAEAKEALGRVGLTTDSEVDSYLAAIAEWTGVRDNYLAAVELARYCVHEDDIRAYAKNGLSREYASILYTGGFES